MIIDRSWALPYDVDDAWGKRGFLARHFPYIYFSDDAIIPTDSQGFRKPIDAETVSEGFHSIEAKSRYICLGGSTTFGWYVDINDAYPSILETHLNDCSVFNFGLGAFNLNSAVHVLVELLRHEIVPTKVIFLDGVNEKQGYRQAHNGYEKFQEEYHDWSLFSKLFDDLSDDMFRRARRYFEQLKSRPLELPSDEKIISFAHDQARSYIQSYKFIIKLADAYNFQPHFFLQPSLLDILPGVAPLRQKYIKEVYRCITLDESVVSVDLSVEMELESSWFIDWQHIDRHGNEALAKAISKHL